MEKIINLQKYKEEHQPHSEGKARCLDCKHEWHSVAPIRTIWLECPKCSLMRGRFIFHHQRDGAHWQCGCENDIFYVTPEGYYCPNCGDWQYGF